MWSSTRFCARTTLFLLYINDLSQSSTYFDFRLFADDSNIFHSFPPCQTIIRLSEVTDHLLSVTKWCDANKITINIKKTNFMVIQPRRKVVNTEGSVELKGCTLNKVDTTPYVGIHIDKYLLSVRRKIGKAIFSKIAENGLFRASCIIQELNTHHALRCLACYIYGGSNFNLQYHWLNFYYEKWQGSIS